MNDRELLLEAELQQARSTIQFLHDCLTGQATYAYPEQTLNFLEELEWVLPDHYWCLHSRRHEGCPGCEQGDQYRTARALLRNEHDPEWELRATKKLIGRMLQGSYNEQGIEQWFARPRQELDGKTPQEMLEDGQEAKVFELARQVLWS